MALPALLETVVLPGSVITIDAMGCQRQVAETIVAGQGDFVLALKRNQPALHQAVALLFAEECQTTQPATSLDHAERWDKGHGRIEHRACWATDDPRPCQAPQRATEQGKRPGSRAGLLGLKTTTSETARERLERLLVDC